MHDLKRFFVGRLTVSSVVLGYGSSSERDIEAALARLLSRRGGTTG
jgi:hypothetical protein